MKAEAITSHARRGAAWSLLIAGLAFPLTLVKTVLLARLDSTGEILGAYRLLLLFLNAIYTFLFPGGRNVFPAYLPKMHDVEDRSRFISGFFQLVVAAAGIGIIGTTLWPGVIDLMMQRQVDGRTRVVLQCLIFFALASALANSIVTGSMSFAWASLLLRVQIVFVAVLAAVMYLTKSPSMIENAVFWLSAAITLAAAFNTVVSCMLLWKSFRFRLRPSFPRGCFKFTVMTYLDTVMMFAYLSVDNYFIAFKFGVAELGIYTAMMEVARFIPLAVQQLGHLLLTTFSKLLGSGNEEGLAAAYRQITRLTVAFYALVSTAIIFFSHPLIMLFGPSYADHHLYLVALCVVMNVDSLRTINGMTLMAYERMTSVFTSKLMQSAVEFCVSLALIGRLGIFGVIIGKGAGHVVSSIALFITTARVTKSVRLRLPHAFYTSQLIVFAAAWTAFTFEHRSILVSALGVAICWTAVWLAGGFRAADLRALAPRRRDRGAAS